MSKRKSKRAGTVRIGFTIEVEPRPVAKTKQVLVWEDRDGVLRLEIQPGEVVELGTNKEEEKP